MQHLEVSCAVRRFFKSLGFKGLNKQYGVAAYWKNRGTATRRNICKKDVRRDIRNEIYAIGYRTRCGNNYSKKNKYFKTKINTFIVAKICVSTLLLLLLLFNF